MPHSSSGAQLDPIAFIQSQIRTVPDWPQPGVMFRDITTLLQSPKALRVLVDLFVERYVDAITANAKRLTEVQHLHVEHAV